MYVHDSTYSSLNRNVFPNLAKLRVYDKGPVDLSLAHCKGYVVLGVIGNRCIAGKSQLRQCDCDFGLYD